MKRVHVAVAVIENDRGEVLVARRAEHQHQGGLWEFPGGKVEAGETVMQALQREIREEIALDVQAAEPLLQIPFQYPDKQVLLDVWRVTAFAGTPQGCEGQPLRWVPLVALGSYDFPAANRAIITALRLPERLLVTGDFASVDDCVQRVSRALAVHAIGGVLLRAHGLAERQFVACAAALQPVCSAHGALLLLNAPAGQALGAADGLHLTSGRLLQCRERPVSDGRLFGASCHNRQEIDHALGLGVDYVTLSPVLPTASHPGEPVLGWDDLHALLQHCPVPVYALGGLSDTDLAAVKVHGGFGVAAISAWWDA